MRQDDKQIMNAALEHHACYILITCGLPSADGQMQVEMTYKGDANVAAYLLQQAQAVVDEQAEDCCAEDLMHFPSKVIDLN